MQIKVALVGNPNSGKTTLFNALTGSNQFVGNWPGVTVEKKEGRLKKHRDVSIVDLPGIYSLSPYTPEEVIARNYLIGEAPDVILNVIDGTNLERNLYLTTQLCDLGIPMVLAVNMSDVVAKSGNVLNPQKLAKEFNCGVVEISALKKDGITALINEVTAVAEAKKVPQIRTFSQEIETIIEKIESAFLANIPAAQRHWFAVKLFENDEKVIADLKLNQDAMKKLQEITAECSLIADDDAESIIINERYQYIVSIIEKCYVKRSKTKLSLSDRIDRVVTNRLLAFPIFVAVMFAVYYVSVSTVGTYLTDWTNDVLFGEIIPPAIEGFLTSVNCAGWLQSLILDGIVAGVGAVLGFVPQMLVLFVFLAFLEGCGYMARIAFIMDRIFRRFGLSGKSFIPMLIGTGCGVPGIMASRTIENDSDRKMTIITTTFVPCGAKLPIIALISGALFGGEWWVASSSYFVGIAAIIVSGIMLKKTKLFSENPAPFVMELPAYHLPTFSNILHSTWERGWSFIKKAGSIVLLSTIFIWFVSGFGLVNGKIVMVDDLNQGFLAAIGRCFAWIFAPLGWGDWKSAVATVTGLVAKENVVGTFGILFGFAEVAEDGNEIWSTLAANFTTLSAYSFLVFNLLCAPCFAAIGAIKREMNNSKWTWFAIGYQTIFAYVIAMCIYQLGMFFVNGVFGFWTLLSIVCFLYLLYLLVRPATKAAISNVESVRR